MFFVLVCGGDDNLTSYGWCVLTVVVGVLVGVGVNRSRLL